MKNQNQLQLLRQLLTKLRTEKPLIHCITNPISINDCANALLAVGAVPIMAEHPDEADEITGLSSALLCNLGNITDIRMKSMRISGDTALRAGIPIVLDAVGVGCSTIRLNYAKTFISDFAPQIIKGNVSEILRLCGKKSCAFGIDSGDKIDVPDKKNIEFAVEYAHATHSVVLMSGKDDIITDGNTAYEVSNGDVLMTAVTGTGCMLGSLAAAYCAVEDGCSVHMHSALLSAAVMGIAGEIADKTHGTGTYHIGLIDAMSMLNEKKLCEKIKVSQII